MDEHDKFTQFKHDHSPHSLTSIQTIQIWEGLIELVGRWPLNGSTGAVVHSIDTDIFKNVSIYDHHDAMGE